MKFSADVSSSRRKARKAHFSSDSESRRSLMSAPLSKQLRIEHKVRSMPVRQGDEVMVKSGSKKGQEGTIKSVYRKKFVIHIDRITRDKCNSALGVRASQQLQAAPPPHPPPAPPPPNPSPRQRGQCWHSPQQG